MSSSTGQSRSTGLRYLRKRRRPSWMDWRSPSHRASCTARSSGNTSGVSTVADKEGNVVYELCRMPAPGWEHTAFWYEVTEEEFRDYKKHPGHLYGRRINGGELPATTKAPDSSDDVRHPKHYEVFGPRVQV